MTLLIAYFLLALVISFVCSLLESVILSVTPAYVALLNKQGRKSGQLLKRFKIEIDKPLSAILSLNTIANTLGATGVGAQVLKVYGDGYVAIASATLTFCILIFSEIIPKTIGAVHWKKMAPACSHIINWLIFITYPLVILAAKIRTLLATKADFNTSREEMIVTAEIGATEGVIRQKESTVIRNLLMLDTIQVSEIMTPRSVLTALNINDTVSDVVEKYKPVRFSRIPLFEDNLDHIKGLLHRYKLMDAVAHDLDDLPLKELMVPIHRVPETISVAAALDQFIKRQEHLFLVVDEYGTPVGIVTLEDAIETLLGVEIMDESDDIEDMRAYALQQWRQKKSNT